MVGHITKKNYKNQHQGFKRLINAFKFSKQGLQSCYQSESAFRQELWLALILIPSVFWATGSAVERVLLIIPIFIVLIIEILNTAIETVVNRIGTDHHLLSGTAKNWQFGCLLYC